MMPTGRNFSIFCRKSHGPTNQDEMTVVLFMTMVIMMTVTLMIMMLIMMLITMAMVRAIMMSMMTWSQMMMTILTIVVAPRLACRSVGGSGEPRS